ncbi:MAG: enoyl-CoA hydratase [Quisquiliibacterium sp.]
MPNPLLLVEIAPEGFAVVTLNRPEAMNALSAQLRKELAAQIDALQADPAVRVLILTGAGKAFCAGLDLKELGEGGEGSAALAVHDADPVSALARFSGPVIAAINGAAITGGFELALACDVLLASNQARFADTHARVGVMPGWGLSQRLSRAIGVNRAKELSLTGNFLSAHKAYDWGLVNRVVEPDQLLVQARELAIEMLSVIPRMLIEYKKLIDEGFATGLADGLVLETELSNKANPQVNAADIAQRRADILARGKAQKSRSD